MKEKSALKKWWAFFVGEKNELANSQLQHSDSWEEDYLVKKIQGKYDNIPEKAIREAVKSCYTEFRSPEPGEKLVKCVITRLRLNEGNDFMTMNK